MEKIARSHVIDMLTLAIADGFVTAEELTLIHQKGKELGLGEPEIDEVIQNPHRVAFEPPASLVDAVARLYDLALVIVTDGTVDPREVGILRSFAARFSIPTHLIDRVIFSLVEEVRAGTPRDTLVAEVSREVAS